MLRTAFLCCIASSLVTACVAEDVPDELAGEDEPNPKLATVELR